MEPIANVSGNMYHNRGISEVLVFSRILGLILGPRATSGPEGTTPWVPRLL